MGQPLAADLAMWADLGVGQVGLISPKLEAQGWDSASTLLRDAGLRVSNIASENAVIAESLRFAAGVEAQTVYFCTGRAASPSWDEATDDLCRSMAALVSLANQLGVRLAVEPTNP